MIKSDDGGEFSEGKFGKLCRERNIKQEFTTADSPEYNGDAERGLALIESAALAARIQASELFPGFNVPEGPSLWAEAMNWACGAYNRTATVGTPGTVHHMKCSMENLRRRAQFPSSNPGFAIKNV